jgi:hypothetical protein
MSRVQGAQMKNSGEIELNPAVRIVARAKHCMASQNDEVCTGPKGKDGVRTPQTKYEKSRAVSNELSCWDEAFDLAKQLGVTKEQLRAAKVLLSNHTIVQIRLLLKNLGE